MSKGPEFDTVESPFIDQLLEMRWPDGRECWKWNTGNTDHSSASGRESFRDILIRSDLEAALRRINLRDGQPWLDTSRITQAIASLEKLGADKLLEASQAATELLLTGTVVDGMEGWEQGRRQAVHFIDWDHPENNTFRAVNQFRVDEPGGQAQKFIVPDLVLFVNGIPIVVVECKAPHIAEPIAQAIDQLQRYANQREWVEDPEGNERLFQTVQLVIATCFDEARVGTFTSQAIHFLEWKDTAPTPMAEVAKALGKERLSSQEKLVAGMLHPAHLLDIIRHFTLFMEAGGRTVKVVCRYQQFRAVQFAIRRLKTGKTKAQDGEYDRRGGIIWHTQGSGKSLTMVFLVRKMRSDTALRRFKVVVVTDRKDLEKQLAKTAALTNEPLTIVKPERVGFRTKSANEVLQETLRRPGKDLVFAMIQKYQGARSEDDEESDEEKDTLSGAPATEGVSLLNESEDILVLVDEAHRSHGSSLHGNLLLALPNCARIGFTGTPIIMGAKKRTHEIFGAFIDRYTLREAEADGAVVPILYEGRTIRAAVQGEGRLDQLFEDMFQRTPEELEAIQRKYATKGQVLEAPALIATKARDMFRHYVDNILPNAFKAQVVAVSRRAALRYREAFLVVRDELVAELEILDPALLQLTEDQVERLNDELAFLVRAHRFLNTLRELDFAAVISSGNNDDPSWKEWTDTGKSEQRIERFKRALFHNDPEKRDPLAFLIVKSMLLTGFDAPVEQVMYLDRLVQEAELLQAIARVNRTHGVGKQAGIVVDYYGIAGHLKQALQAYSADDINGALQSLKDELPKLRDRHQRVLDLFSERGIRAPDGEEACIEALRDERLRAEFQVKLRQFLETLDLVLPRPEGLPYVQNAKKFAYIQARTRTRYRDGMRPIGKDVGAKVRKIIDDHVESFGIRTTIQPIQITDEGFDDHVKGEKSPRAKASEMEHALRYHIRKHLDEDPGYYDKLSNRLESILLALEGQWEAQIDALNALVVEARVGRARDETGLDPATQAPFFDVLKGAVAEDGALDTETQARLVDHTVELVAHIQQELGLVGFWKSPHAQEVLRKWMVLFLDGDNTRGEEIVPFERQGEVADLLMERAKANHHRLIG